MTIYVVYCVVSADENNKQSYILSLDKDNIVFPVYKLESPKYIQNEIRYNIKSIFKPDNIQFIEQVIVSNLTVQNELLLDYISDFDTNKVYDTDTNLFLLCGIVISKLEIIDNSEISWIPFHYSIEDKTTKPVYSIIDTVLQSSL